MKLLMISPQINMCLYLRHTKLLFHFFWWLQVQLWWHPIMFISNPIESLRLYVQSFSEPKLWGSVNTVDTHRHMWSYRSYSHITSWALFYQSYPFDHQHIKSYSWNILILLYKATYKVSYNRFPFSFLLLFWRLV